MENAKIRKPFEARSAIPASSGSPIREVFVRKFDEKGVPTLVKVGERDMEAYINSFASEVDVNNIVKRYMNGDLTALERADGVYFDATGMPRDLAQALNILRQSENVFNSLPEELRKDYKDYTEFLGEFSSPDRLRVFNQRMIDHADKQKAAREAKKDVVVPKIQPKVDEAGGKVDAT